MRDGTMRDFCQRARSLLDEGKMPRPPESSADGRAERFAGWFSHPDVRDAMTSGEGGLSGTDYADGLEWCHRVLSSLDDAMGHQGVERELSKIMGAMGNLSQDRAPARTSGIAFVGVSEGPMGGQRQATAVLCFSKEGFRGILTDAFSERLAPHMDVEDAKEMLFAVIKRMAAKAGKEAFGCDCSPTVKGSSGGGGAEEAFPTLDVDLRPKGKVADWKEGARRFVSMVEEGFSGLFGACETMEFCEEEAHRLGFIVDTSSRMGSIAAEGAVRMDRAELSGSLSERESSAGPSI